MEKYQYGELRATKVANRKQKEGMLRRTGVVQELP